MRISVLSGKGGTGKTFVSVNFAAAAKRATYIDCDVEEPDGRLFLKPENVVGTPVFTRMPCFDLNKCTGCRKCVEFCRFNALVFIREKPKVFTEVCHSCGGCALVCPENAVFEEKRQVGSIEKGYSGDLSVVTGIINIGEASAVPVIRAALNEGGSDSGLIVIDCPPGSGCSVTECVMGSDYCIIVAEPTAFGFHNFKMAYKLVSLLGKPLGVVINKIDMPYKPLEDFCEENSIPVLLRIPYSRKAARDGAAGKLVSRSDGESAALFDGLLKTVAEGKIER